MFYYLITDITNIIKYPTDDWLTTFPFNLSRMAYYLPVWNIYYGFISNFKIFKLNSP
jgi:hypothetical protein